MGPEAQEVDQIGSRHLIRYNHPNVSYPPGGTVISTFFSTRKCLSNRAWIIAGLIVLVACGGGNALAQSSALTPGVLEHPAVTPPLLFREVWQQPPHTGPLND